MSVKPVVFVIGASGSVGSATVACLSANYADKVDIRAGVRNPDSDKAQKLKTLTNVTTVQATMGDSNLASVLTGVSTLYIVTPGADNRVKPTISTAECAKEAGVKHIAVVSIPTAELPDTIYGGQLAEVEEKISNLGVPYTIIRLPMFMDNLWSMKTTIVGQSTIYNCVAPDRPIAAIAVEDIGKASAVILTQPEKYADKTLTFVGDRYTYNDLIEALSTALGKEIKYVRVSYEDTKKQMLASGWLSELRAEGFMELCELIDASSPTVTDSHPGVFKDVTGEEPMSLKQWVAKNAAGFH